MHMGVIFNKLVEAEEHIEDTFSSPIYFNQTAESFVSSYYNEHEEEYNNYLLENMRGAFLAAKSSCMEITIESFDDFVENVIEWFQKWIMKFKNFITSCIKNLIQLFTNANTIVDKYNSKPLPFKAFDVQGYTYTIPDGDLPAKLFGQYENTVINYAVEISRCGPNDLAAVLANAKAQVCGEDFLNVARGLVVNKSAITSAEYPNELRLYFRNYTEIHKIHVDQQYAIRMCNEYAAFRKALDSIKANRNELELNVRAVMRFIKSERSYYTYKDKKATLTDTEIVDRKDTALSNYFTCVNMTLKQLHLIYDMYYAKKMDALREAILFYGKTLNKVYKLSQIEKAGGNV